MVQKQDTSSKVNCQLLWNSDDAVTWPDKVGGEVWLKDAVVRPFATQHRVASQVRWRSPSAFNNVSTFPVAPWSSWRDLEASL